MKKFSIALNGGTALLIGVAMLVLPGPGMLVIAGGGAGHSGAGFFWARRALRKAKGAVSKLRRKAGLVAGWRKMKLRGKLHLPAP